MATSMKSYETWLTKKLLSVNPDTDTDVFVSYITGILEEEADKDEKKESLSDFLSQVVEDDQESLCDEVLAKWDELLNKDGQAECVGTATATLTDQLSNIVIQEQQKIESVKLKGKSSEEKARKAAILASYSAVCDGDVDSDTDDPGGAKSGPAGDLLDLKNMNAASVKKNELEMRDRQKQESEKKREKDKQDREAHKQKLKERKETEKKRTQKGEKRR